MLGAVLRPTAAGPCLVCYDNDPQFELNLPEAVLSQLGPGASLVVDMTPRPLLEALPELLKQTPSLPTIGRLEKRLDETRQLIKSKIERRDALIAAQQSELEVLKARQKALETQLQRAEAQLEVLKEFVLAAFGKAGERISDR